MVRKSSEAIDCVKILSMTPRVVFMGSPAFALPVLQKLAGLYPVVGVVTQPDRPAGRGQVLTPPPVKELAERLHIPVIQPNRLKEPEAVQRLVSWKPDLIVVAAFGQILRQNVLDLPAYGCINVHASLLPRWRGAAPIQAAILHGDPETGVSIMKMDAGVDSGPVLSQRAIAIRPDDTTGSLSSRLAQVGAELLVETLPGYIAGKTVPQPQDESQATRAPLIKKEDGLLDFRLPALDLERKLRAFAPWPGTFFLWQGMPLKVLQAHVNTRDSQNPGRAGVIDKLPAIATGSGWLVLDLIQPAGKKSMPGDVFLRGARSWTDWSFPEVG
jgi:methionyl-tRNA formyltransferase